MTDHKFIISSILVALSLCLTIMAQASDASKAAVIDTLNAEIAKKGKPWDDLANDPSSRNYTYWNNCKRLKATHCHTYLLSHKKVEGRVLRVLRVFDKACLENGGRITEGTDPSYDEIDNFFSANHFVVNRPSIPVKSNQLFCEFGDAPALSLYIDSEQAQRRGDGNLVSKDAFYEKARMYIYISDLDAIAPDLKQAELATQKETKISETCMQAPLKIGDRSLFGLVVDVRTPLVQIQRETKLEWMQADKVKRDIRECMENK